MANVYRIVLGMCNVYLVRENDHCILIDAGNAHKEKQFARELKKYHLIPQADRNRCYRALRAR